jgi:hypothetical protein
MAWGLGCSIVVILGFGEGARRPVQVRIYATLYRRITPMG